MARADEFPLPVVACDLTVFEPGARARHAQLLALLRAAVLTRDELTDGSRFTLDASAFAVAAEWITYERRCCGFFDFRLDWPSAGNPSLTITGPPGAKEMLADWLS